VHAALATCAALVDAQAMLAIIMTMRLRFAGLLLS
jgi:hypothetical protein